MNDCTVYRLRPRAPFHFGERGVDLEASVDTFRSDSLFSAIVSALRELRGAAEAERLLALFQDESATPPFLLSSCFPFAGEVLLFPRPFVRPNLARDPETGRRLKKVRYVSLENWRRLAAGASLDGELTRNNLLQGGSTWVSTAEADRLRRDGITHDSSLWKRQVAPRVTLDRLTSASELYGCGRVTYSPGCGLFFLARHGDNSWREQLEAALRLLGESGLGGERSCGCGLFDPEIDSGPVDLTVADSTGAFATLATYAPTLAELRAGALEPPASYDLVSRFGWVCSPEGSGLRRKDVTMIADGSVVRGASPPRGALVDVTPEGFHNHRVYRYGLAFPIPVKIDGGGPI